MKGWASSTSVASAFGRARPALIAGSCAALAALAQVPWVALLSGLVMVLLAPIAHLLATRVLLWSIAVLAVMSLTASTAWIPFNSSTAALLIFLGMLVSLIISAWLPGIPWRPMLPLADGIVMVGGVLVVLILVAPYAAASPDMVLLDLARGYDQLNHFAVFSNILTEQDFEWVTRDGSGAVASGYPMGVHSIAAMGNLLGPRREGEELLLVFGWVSAVGVALSATAVGWTAVRMAHSTGPVGDGPLRGSLAAVIWMVFAPLGGAFAGAYELGHVPFILPAALGISASWMALSIGRRYPGRAMTLLVVAAIASAGSYPPLLAGLLPAVIVTVVPRAATRTRLWLVGLGAVFLALLILLLLRYRSSLQFVATASGEHSTPMITPLTMSAVALLLVLAAQTRGYRAPLRGLAVVAGYASVASAITIMSIWRGYPPTSNYYVAKFLQATWLAELPIILGVGSWGITIAMTGYQNRVRVPWLIICAMAVSLLLAVVPDGRYLGMGGPALLSHRVREMGRAGDSVQVVAASRVTQPGTDVSAVLVQPTGWFLPVAADDSDPDPPVRDGALASKWLNELRGVRSATQEEAALCMKGAADEDSIPCLEDWLERHDTLRLALVFAEGGRTRSFDELQARHPERVEIVRLPQTGQPRALAPAL